MKVKDVVRMKIKVRELMEMIRTIGKRQSGMGFNRQSHHAALHTPDDMLQYGVPTNFNVESNESHHKKAKTAALKTQRRMETFDFQTATQMFFMEIIELAMCELAGKPKWRYRNRPQKTESEVQIDEQNAQENDPLDENSGAPCSKKEQNWRNGLRGCVEYRYDEGENFGVKVIVHSSSRHKKEIKEALGDDLHKFVASFLSSWATDNKTLMAYQEHKRNGQIFRANALHNGAPWRDWVMIDWKRSWGKLPSQIWLFLDLRDIEAPITFKGDKYKAGVYAIVEHASKVDEDLGEPNVVDPMPWSSLFIPYLKDTGEDDDGCVVREFHLVDVETFAEPTCLFPDLGNEDSRAYYRLLPRNEWADLFLAWVRSNHAREFEEAMP